jgi:glycosyltransferase involved in cell wall biosynthesis
MRIAAITSGAAGMFCGSCLHDNSLVTALRGLGHDAMLIPTYTPIRTDEPDVSQRRVFLGGLNVYFNYKSALFRRLPRLVHWLLDRPTLLRSLSRFTATPDYAALGEITLSMLRGETGRQREEVDRLAAWLAADAKPEIVTLSNVLLSGVAPALKRRLGVPVVAYLQGDDIFLDALHPEHRVSALELIRANAASIDGLIATSRDYAEHMADYLSMPLERIDVVHPGLNLAGYTARRVAQPSPPYTIGYFARIAPEKGLHVLGDAFRLLRDQPGTPPVKLRASGWLGPQHRDYLAGVRKSVGDGFEYVDSPDHAAKVRFLQSVDVLSVPTTYREPKGLYVLEALANGVPVVQPEHGSFPELITATGGGLLVKPNDPADLARGLQQVLADPALRMELGQKGRQAVHERFSAAAEAGRTVEVLRRHVR